MINGYDFDETIYDGDSSVDFFKYSLKRNKKVLLQAPIQVFGLILYILKIIDKTKFKEYIFSFLKRINNIDDYIEDFWDIHYNKIKPWYLNQKKKTDVIISASPEFLLKPLEKKLNVLIIASKVDKKTGEFLSKNCHDYEKISRYEKVSKKKMKAFYSDSVKSDRAMFEYAKEAYLVTGNKIEEIDIKSYGKEKTKNYFDLKNKSMTLFFMLCMYFLCILVLYSVFQILNINNMLLVIGIVAIIIPIIYILKKERSIILALIFLLIVTFIPFLNTKIYDLSIDGNDYHKTAIAFIKNGWNPLYESARDFQKHNSKVIPINKKSKVDIWIEHYPKASWIYAAVMYNLTGCIEAGKALIVILSIMLLIITYNVLRKILDKNWSIVFTIFLVLNPIVLTQIFTFYVDGIMGICFLIQLLLLFMVDPEEKANMPLWISIISISTIFCNLKFTGLMCSGVIAATFYFYWLFKYKNIKVFKRLTILFTIVYVTSIFLVGSNSYVKNTIDHINPLYPLIGKNKVDIVTTMQPKDFAKMSKLEKWYYSMFSKTENTTYYQNRPTLKYPFIVYSSEVKQLYIPDTRIGGFGPLFALSFILSIIVFIPMFIILIKNEKDKMKYVLIPIITTLITMVLLGESWWARYVPHFYYLIVGVFILSVYLKKYVKYKKLHIMFDVLCLLVLFINLCFFLKVVKDNIISAHNNNRDLAEMKYIEDLKIHFADEEYGYQYLLNDKGINYTKVEIDNQDNFEYKLSWRLEVKK